jgi:hypothetical protein
MCANRCREAVQPTVAVWGRLAAVRRTETPFAIGDFCQAPRCNRQKQQALRRAGGPEELMLKKT